MLNILVSKIQLFQGKIKNLGLFLQSNGYGVVAAFSVFWAFLLSLPTKKLVDGYRIG